MSPLGRADKQTDGHANKQTDRQPEWVGDDGGGMGRVMTD